TNWRYPGRPSRRGVPGMESAPALLDVRPTGARRGGEVVRREREAPEGARDARDGRARLLLLSEPALQEDHDPGALAPHLVPGGPRPRRRMEPDRALSGVSPPRDPQLEDATRTNRGLARVDVRRRRRRHRVVAREERRMTHDARMTNTR